MTSTRLPLFAALALLSTSAIVACDELPDDPTRAGADGAEDPAGAADEAWDEDEDGGSTGDAGCEDGCDGDEPGGDDAPSSDADDAGPVGAPQLQVLLTDAPLDVDAVLVTISEVRVHSCGALEDGGDEPAEDDPEPEDADEPDEEPADDGEDAPDGDDGAGPGGGPGHGPPDGHPGGGPDHDEPEEDEPEEDEPEEDESEDDEGEPDECEGGGWQSVVEEEATFDLLTLQDGVTEALGLAVLPPGHYGQIRLMLVEASVVVDGEEFPLTIPSGTQSGIKLNHGFDLTEGMLTTITLDFDAGKSVHHTPGNGWMMRPVIDVIASTSEPIPEEPVEEPGDDGDDGQDDGQDDGADDGQDDGQDDGEPQPG